MYCDYIYNTNTNTMFVIISQYGLCGPVVFLPVFIAEVMSSNPGAILISLPFLFSFILTYKSSTVYHIVLLISVIFCFSFVNPIYLLISCFIIFRELKVL